MACHTVSMRQPCHIGETDEYWGDIPDIHGRCELNRCQLKLQAPIPSGYERHLREDWDVSPAYTCHGCCDIDAVMDCLDKCHLWYFTQICLLFVSFPP